MTTITLPDDLAQRLAKVAQARGTTAEQGALESLRQVFPSEAGKKREAAGETLRDFLAAHIGVIDGPREAVSQDCGRRFEDALVEDRQRGQS
jgi:hypothetical protein